MSSEAIFSALAARHPDSVVFHGSSFAWRARDVFDELASLAQRLDGSRVLAILADNSPDWAMADLAALQTRTPVLPLPLFFTAAQLAHALTQTGTDTVLTDQPERILALDLGFTVAEQRRGQTWLRRHAEYVDLPAGTAKISFTSGSTGAPKGVCLSAEGLLATALALKSRLADLLIERHLCVLPLALLLENSAGIYAPLLRGAEVHLPGLADLGWQGMSGFDPRLLQQRVAAVGASSVILVPELLKAWVLLLARAGLSAPESLVFAAVGGARVEPGLLAAARTHGLPAYQGYGLTECGSVVSLNVPGDDKDGVGRPLPHVSASIEDGEVRVATRAFLGYLGDAGQPADAAYATGDLGRLDAEGHLHLSGRRKNLLITSFGRNVSPEWVESALLAQPEIAQAIVVGDGHPALAAVVVPFAGVDRPQLANAVGRANAGLPDYARLAGWVDVEPFSPQSGTLTGNGRPVRAAILERHAARLAALYDSLDEQHAPKETSDAFYEQLAEATASERAYLLSSPIITKCLNGEVTRESYLAFLGQAFHHVRHTTPLLMLLGGRLPERLAWLRRAVAEYIEEEIGHEEWILNDIAAAGGDADAVRLSRPELPAEVMVAYAYDLVNRGNPAGFFGMVFVLEGTSVAMALTAADQIQKALQLPGAAFSYLRSHGTLDQEHTRHLADLLEKMTPDDQQEVIRCARVFFRLYAEIFRSLPL